MAVNSEFPEEQGSERPDFHRYLDVARRRHMHFLIPLLVGWLVVWGAGWVLPPRYESTTLILVEQPSMPSNYVTPNVSEDLQDRLQSITQQILSRTRLLSIIDRLRLYGEGRNQGTPDEKVDLMRKDIDIALVQREDKKGITGFTITYKGKNPQIAQQVTGELTDLFIDENLKARQQHSEDTTSFMESQLANASASLAEQEAKVRDYEAKHEGDLPSQQASNLQILSGLQAQLQSEQDALNNAKQQGVYFQALIGQYRALSAASGAGDGGPTTLPAIDQQLDTLKSKLANLRSHYTDRHPDIQSLKDEIARTEKMRDQLFAGSKDNGKDGGHAGEAPVTRDMSNPTQNQAILQLESQQQANKLEIANRERAIVSLNARIDEYQARLNSEPARAQELADLTRGYDQSKANYDDLLKKENDSSMATNMERMQQGERFTMLDPPSLPTRPTSPDRLKLCGIGLGVGLALGLIVVIGFEFMDDRMHSEKEIKALLPVAIISEIPEIATPSDERTRKRRMAFGWAMAALVFVTILAGSAFTYLLG
jgi:polysaccharide chain length determinant protein (PEP-CTERM system associated)